MLSFFQVNALLCCSWNMHHISSGNFCDEMRIRRSNGMVGVLNLAGGKISSAGLDALCWMHIKQALQCASIDCAILGQKYLALA